MSDLPRKPSTADDELVLTPGGLRRRHEVQAVRPGEVVRAHGDGRAVITPAEQPGRPRRQSMSNKLVLTPGGYRHPSLVHRVDPGFAVDHVDGRPGLMRLATREVMQLPPPVLAPGAVPGFGSGWITYGYWTNGTGNPVTSFRTTWTVPAAPKTNNNQTIFLFNGIDPSDPSAAILQPVLQWGPSHAGGGNYWSVASWYVMGTGQAFYTPLVKVNEGDELVGVMQLTAQNGALFSYASEFQGIGGTNLPVQNVSELVWLNETLEAYGITTCSDYPNVDFTAMREVAVATGNSNPPISWSGDSPVTDCGQHSVIASNSATEGEVDLYYRNPTLKFDLHKYAQYIDILFGVVHGEGGIGIVNGHIVRIPPRGPDSILFSEIARGVQQVLRGFAVRDVARGSDVGAIERAGLELMRAGLQSSLKAVNNAIESQGG